MSRLVIISNRVILPKGSQPQAGGLAVGVLAALQEYGGLWYGCDGRVTDGEPSGPVFTEAGKVSYATIDLNQQLHDGYYNGFSNNILWPLFHYMLGYFNYSRQQYESYQEVNRLFAERLLPLLRSDDLIWVHDYHLIPLGQKLRDVGVAQPVGFFLHVPFPAYDMLRVLPPVRALLEALCEYDVVGFQTQNDLDAFHDCLVHGLNASVEADGTVTACGRTFYTGVFPIGVDVNGLAEMSAARQDSSYARRLQSSLGDRDLIIGVDRLDYSKGLPERLHSYECLLQTYPEHLAQVVLLQIAAPSRIDIRGYQEIKRELEESLGQINGKYADFDWVPIRYLEKTFEREVLMAFFQVAKVGLVTPLRDGMNLVAKEFVVSQAPQDPGVLVLSQLAGAARELTSAIVVNPYDTDAVASALKQALTMPLEQRKERFQDMMSILHENNITAWYTRFLKELRKH